MSTLKINKLERQVKRLKQQIETQRMITEMEHERLNAHWSSKFDMIVGIFEAQLNEDIEVTENVFRPRTLNEFKKWFREWTADVNGIDAEDDNAGEYMADIIEKHRFEFEIKSMPVSHREILEKY